MHVGGNSSGGERSPQVEIAYSPSPQGHWMGGVRSENLVSFFFKYSPVAGESSFSFSSNFLRKKNNNPIGDKQSFGVI